MNVWQQLFGASEMSEVQNIEQAVESAAADAVADVKSVFVDTEKAVLAALGHVHNLLGGFSLTAEVQAAKSGVESAIINFAKHLGA